MLPQTQRKKLRCICMPCRLPSQQRRRPGRGRAAGRQASPAASGRVHAWRGMHARASCQRACADGRSGRASRLCEHQIDTDGPVPWPAERPPIRIAMRGRGVAGPALNSQSTQGAPPALSRAHQSGPWPAGWAGRVRPPDALPCTLPLIICHCDARRIGTVVDAFRSDPIRTLG